MIKSFEIKHVYKVTHHGTELGMFDTIEDADRFAKVNLVQYDTLFVSSCHMLTWPRPDAEDIVLFGMYRKNIDNLFICDFYHTTSHHSYDESTIYTHYLNIDICSNQYGKSIGISNYKKDEMVSKLIPYFKEFADLFDIDKEMIITFIADIETDPPQYSAIYISQEQASFRTITWPENITWDKQPDYSKGEFK